MNVLASPLFSEIDTVFAKSKISRLRVQCNLIFAPGTTKYILHEKSKKIPVKNRFYKSFIKETYTTSFIKFSALKSSFLILSENGKVVEEPIKRAF